MRVHTAIAAADAAVRTDWSRWRAPLARWSARLALPVAAALLIAGYAQALLGVVPLGRKDPLARLLAVGLPEVMTKIDTLRVDAGAEAILTSDYATAAWLAFYGSNPVVDLGEDYRWPDAPIPAVALLGKPALYVTEMRKDHHDILAAHFERATVVGHIDRYRKGVPIAHYIVYRVTGLKGHPPGRLL